MRMLCCLEYNGNGHITNRVLKIDVSTWQEILKLFLISIKWLDILYIEIKAVWYYYSIKINRMKEVSYMYIQYKLNLKKMSGMGPEIIKIKDILPGKIVIYKLS